MPNYMPRGMEFNPNVINDIDNFEKKINEELSKDKIDNDKLLKLRTQKLYRGLEMGSALYRNNYRAMFPY